MNYSTPARNSSKNFTGARITACRSSKDPSTFDLSLLYCILECFCINIFFFQMWGRRNYGTSHNFQTWQRGLHWSWIVYCAEKWDNRKPEISVLPFSTTCARLNGTVPIIALVSLTAGIIQLWKGLVKEIPVVDPTILPIVYVCDSCHVYQEGRRFSFNVTQYLESSQR